MKMTVCIPMYNESSVIADTATTLSTYMSSNFDDYEILFSDDGSRDGSAEIVKSLNLPNVRVIENPVNQGKGAAVRAAMLESTGDYVLFTDADLAYGTDVIKGISEAFLNDPKSDVIIGSRNVDKSGYEEYTFMRKMASKIYIKFLCMIGGFRMSDSQCGCKAFTGKAAKEIFSRCKLNGFSFDFEVLLWAETLGMKVCEHPVKIIHHRESKIRLVRDSLKMIRDVIGIKKSVRASVRKEKNEKN